MDRIMRFRLQLENETNPYEKLNRLRAMFVGAIHGVAIDTPDDYAIFNVRDVIHAYDTLEKEIKAELDNL